MRIGIDRLASASLKAEVALVGLSLWLNAKNVGNLDAARSRLVYNSDRFRTVSHDHRALQHDPFANERIECLRVLRDESLLHRAMPANADF